MLCVNNIAKFIQQWEKVDTLCPIEGGESKSVPTSNSQGNAHLSRVVRGLTKFPNIE